MACPALAGTLLLGEVIMLLALQIAATIILIEAVTNILSKSDLFNPIREFLFNKGDNKLFRFVHNMVDCPYCLSVWVSLLCTIMLYLYINNLLPFILTWVCIVLILHRLSNIVHFVIDKTDSNHTSLDKDH